MAEYVYVYIHPAHGYVYVGRTNNIYNRIKTHDTGINDNIDPEYVDLLRECSVYYIELANKAESISVEAYLINKEKPLLNTALVYDNQTSSLQMVLPEFKKLPDVQRRYSNDTTSLAQELLAKQEAADHIVNDIKELNEKIDSLQKTYTLSVQTVSSYENVLSHKTADDISGEYYELEEVEWFCSKVRDDVSFVGKIVDGNYHKKDIVCGIKQQHLIVDGRDYGDDKDSVGRTCAKALANLCSYVPSVSISRQFIIELEHYIGMMRNSINEEYKSFLLKDVVSSLSKTKDCLYESFNGLVTINVLNKRIAWARLEGSNIDKRTKQIDEYDSLSDDEQSLLAQYANTVVYRHSHLDRNFNEKRCEIRRCEDMLANLKKRISEVALIEKCA